MNKLLPHASVISNSCTVGCTVCVGVCVCERCVRKTETRSLHGGIPPLKETPLFSVNSSQQDIMGTKAQVTFISAKATSLLHVISNGKFGKFDSQLLISTQCDKTRFLRFFFLLFFIFLPFLGQICLFFQIVYA